MFLFRSREVLNLENMVKMFLTWVGEDLFSGRDVDEFLFRFLFIRFRLEVVWVPLLRQLPVRLDDFLLVGVPEDERERRGVLHKRRGVTFSQEDVKVEQNEPLWTGYLPTPRIL